MVAPKLQLRTITLGDTADAWAAAGFAVDTSNGFATVRLGATTIQLVGGQEPGFLGWGFEAAAERSQPGDLDGLPVTWTAAPVDDPVDGRLHPNGIETIDHVVVMTGDVQRTVSALAHAGFELRGQRSTTMAGSAVLQSFFWAGDVIIELVGPDAGEPTTDGSATIFGLALVADDLDVTASYLGDRIGTPRPAVQPGRRIATLRGRQLGISVPLAVMSPHVRPSS